MALIDCIYCGETKNRGSREHVLARAFAGSGADWELVGLVCTVCNGLFSRNERAWTASPPFAEYRLGSGPRGRTRRDQSFSFHPGLEIFIRLEGDPISYEADLLPGFDARYRYQLIDIGSEVVSVVGFQEDGERFVKAWPRFLARPEITLQKRFTPSGALYRVASLELSNPVRIGSIEWRKKAAIAWWDRFSTHFAGEAHPRLSLDPMSYIRFRTRSFRDVPKLLARIFEIGTFNSQANLSDTGRFTVSMTSVYQKPQVDQAVAKTLVNYLIDQRGAGFVRHPAFAAIRAYCLGGPDRTDLVPFVCEANGRTNIQPLDDLPENRHMLYLIANPYYVIGFIKLYGAFAYQVFLGANPSGESFEHATLIDYNGPGRIPLPLA